MENQRLEDLHSKDASFGKLLGTLGDEFAEIACFAEQLQTVLSPALLSVAHDPDSHKNVQMLDILSQRLNAMSEFVSLLGRSVPDTWRINSGLALSAVTLSDLAMRLQGYKPFSESDDAGCLEMF